MYIYPYKGYNYAKKQSLLNKKRKKQKKQKNVLTKAKRHIIIVKLLAVQKANSLKIIDEA